MFEMLLKQYMPDFDLESIKAQAGQFAAMFGELCQGVKRIEAKQDQLIALLQSQAVDGAQALTVTQEKEIDNGHQCLDGNAASAPGAGG